MKTNQVKKIGSGYCYTSRKPIPKGYFYTIQLRMRSNPFWGLTEIFDCYTNTRFTISPAMLRPSLGLGGKDALLVHQAIS